MLELRRLRLLSELHVRGTIAAVADALQFTPSAVSQQLAMLEREAGVPLVERAGRGVRLTDAALLLVEHAEALLERTARAEADRRRPRNGAGRGRIAGFESVALRLALPAMESLTREAPRLRCELLELEPEEALPGLALGDIDLVLADEWEHQPQGFPLAWSATTCSAIGAPRPAGARPGCAPPPGAVSLAELAGEAWTTGRAGLGQDEMTRRSARSSAGSSRTAPPDQ